MQVHGSVGGQQDRQGPSLLSPGSSCPAAVPNFELSWGAGGPCWKWIPWGRAGQGGCSASLGLVAPGPLGSLGLAVLGCVKSRKAESSAAG